MTNEKTEGFKITLTRLCRGCNTEHSVKVNAADLERWYSPERPYVQDCFPYLTPSERELFFQTGLCEKCLGF